MTNKGQPGVRYISEDLIKKITKQDNLEMITILNLTLSKEGGKKIKYIENLIRLKKLHTLNLSCNMIEKMEKLDKLTKLKELNLSYNCLTKIENLEMLTSLQILNLTGNLIEHIPAWISKKLKALRTFKMAKNKIESLQEFTKLRPLKDLIQLTVAENPVTQLPHSRLFLVFHLRTLEGLDGQTITRHERETAHSRFAQEEIEHLESLMEKQQEKTDKLREEHNRSLEDYKEKEQREKEYQEKLKNSSMKISELQRELDTKSDLLKRKTAELNTACEKHYELEQELAFYKIDHKFDSWRQQPPSYDSDAGSVSDGLIGESPYVGKGRFQQKFKDGPQRKPRTQGPQPVPEEATDEPDQNIIDTEIKRKMLEALDQELGNKKQAIGAAQDRLKSLQDELRTTENQMKQATQELQKMAQSAQITSGLREDDKRHIRSKIAKKVSTVHDLQAEANQIHAELQATQDDIHNNERDIGQLKGQLRRINSTESIYGDLKREMSDKEQQLDLDNRQYAQLQQQLEDMLTHVAQETEDIRSLEQNLREGMASQNEEIKRELQGIIDGLQGYIMDMRGKAADERAEFEELLREREDLLQQLRDMEADKSELLDQTREVDDLRQQVHDLENELDDKLNINKSLQQEIGNLQANQEDEHEKSRELEQLDGEVAKLQDMLKSAERQMQGERDAFNEKMELEKKKNKAMAERVLNMSDKEDEVKNLHHQLSALQNANARLQDQLYNSQQKLRDQMRKNIAPDDLKRRLADLMRQIRSGRQRQEEPQREDRVGQALAEVQDKMQHELDKSLHEVEMARQAQAKAEADLDALRQRLSKVKDRERHRAEQAMQTQMDEDRDEMDRLRDEVERLQDELDRSRAAVRDAPLPDHLLEPSSHVETGSSAGSGTGSGSERTTTGSSTIPSSQWSQKKQQLYNTMTDEEQALFDELQREIEELRKLLAIKDPGAAKKIADVETLAQGLRDLVERRSMGVGGDSTPRQHDTSQQKSYGDPRLRQAAEDLARAEEEIDFLTTQLDDRDAVVKQEMAHSDITQQTVAAQQDELDQLHDILVDQRGEIQRLNTVLDRLTGGRPDGLSGGLDGVPYADEVAQLRRGALNVRSAIASHEPSIQRLGIPPAQAAGHIPQQQPGYHDHHGEPVAQDYRLPVPTFYPQPPQGQTYTQPAAQYVPQGQVPYGAGQGQGQGEYMPAGPGVQSAYTQPPNYAPQPVGPAGMVHPQASGLPGQPPGGSPIRYQPAAHPGGAGVTYAPDGVTVLSAGGQPVTPVGQRSQGIFSAQTTPVAGSILSVPTSPIGKGTQPVMMSTPKHPDAPKKGILKKTMQADDTLICTVPEHHDLEDYVATLQKKIKSLKSKLKEQKELTPDGDGVMFDDDVERQAIRRLKAELEERRAELESLDMAVEKQKAELKKMHELEMTLIERRDAARKELEELYHGKPNARKASRRAFLAGNRDPNKVDADYDYDFDPHRWGTRKQYLSSEIECLEETLAKRRAELREADRLLQECTSELKDAREGAKTAVKTYENAKVGYHSTVREAEELEHRAHSAGVELVKAQEDIHQLKSEVHELNQVKEQQESMLEEIQAVIKEKDANFQKLETQAKQMTQRLHQLQQEVTQADNKYREKGALLQELDGVLNEKHREVDRLKQQITSHHSELDELDHQRAQCQSELQNVTETINKREGQLAVIDKDVEAQVEKRRDHIKGIEVEVQGRLSEKRAIEQEMLEKRARLEKVRNEISDAEMDLQIVIASCNKQKSELQSLQNSLRQERSDLDSVCAQIVPRQAEFRKLQSDVAEEKQHLAALQSELRDKKQDLKHARDGVESEQDRVSALHLEQRALETAISSLRTEKTLMENTQKALEQKLQLMRRSQSQLESEVDSAQAHLSNLERVVSDTEQELDASKGQGVSIRKELDSLTVTLNGHRSDLSLLDSELDTKKKDLKRTKKELAEKQKRKAECEEVLQKLQSDVEKLQVLKLELSEDHDTQRQRLEDTRVRVHDSLTQYEDLTKKLSSRKLEYQQLNAELTNDQRELDLVKDKLSSSQRDLDRKGHTEERFMDLERRVKDLGGELSRRREERDHLGSELEQSAQELHSLREALAKDHESASRTIAELEVEIGHLNRQLDDKIKDQQQLKAQHRIQIGELETTSRENEKQIEELQEELSVTQAELQEAQVKLKILEEVQNGEQKLENTLKELKTDIKAEVSHGLAELEKSRVDAEEEAAELHEQKEDIQQCLENLKDNLNTIRASTAAASKRAQLEDLQASKEALQGHMVQKQDFLKEQLKQKMMQHQETMQIQRQLSNDTLQNLRRKLNTLEQVLSGSSGYASSHSEHGRVYDTDVSVNVLSCVAEKPDDALTTRDLSMMRSTSQPLRSASPYSSVCLARSSPLIPERGPVT